MSGRIFVLKIARFKNVGVICEIKRPNKRVKTLEKVAMRF